MVMSGKDSGEGRIVTMERRRRQILLGSVVAFGTAQILNLLADSLPLQNRHGVHFLLTIAGLIAMVYWASFMRQLAKYQKELKENPALAQSMNDEMVAHIRLKSFVVGFVATMALQVAFILLSLFFTLKAETAAQLTILVGTVASISAFLYYDRD